MKPAGRDRLETYRRKRNFGVTPEPPPDAPAAPGGSTFMVHKHDATRLHYDLRLEIDGALASWALPRGPHYDTRERRLAVETEDHPMAYGAFEGRIPDGEYGAGDSLIWDRGTYQTFPPGQIAAMRTKGHLQLEFAGEKLKGRWHLVRTKAREGSKAQWLFFKAQDALADAKFDVVAERPESVVSGRRLTRGPAPADVRRARRAPIAVLIGVWPPLARRPRRGWQRALVALAGGRVAIQSAEGRDMAAGVPSLVAVLARWPVAEAVVDGDVRGLSGLAARFEPVDLLWVDGRDVRDLPAEDRRDLLAGIVAPIWRGAGS